MFSTGSGKETVAKQPEVTIEKWKKSIASYESALKLNAKDQDAVYNRDLVKRRLAALEEQQKQQDTAEGRTRRQTDRRTTSRGRTASQGKSGQQDQAEPDGKAGPARHRTAEPAGPAGPEGPAEQQGEQGQQNQLQNPGQPQQGTAQPKPAATHPDSRGPARRARAMKRTRIERSRRFPASSPRTTPRSFSMRFVETRG